MTSQLHEYQTLQAAKAAHHNLARLNWRPFYIFQTARGTWAFWVR
jgi:hypothetical protein